ncbi:MAG: hypothetical protein AB7I19_10530 [Planctomycetota bacterium]
MNREPNAGTAAATVAWIARGALALTLIGQPARVLFSGGKVFDALYTELRWCDEMTALGIDRAMLVAMAIGALVVLSPRPRLGFVLGGLGLTVTMIATMIVELRWQSLVPIEQALRWSVPWILLLWLDPRGRPIPDRTDAAVECLRVAVAATFVGHGIEALARNPHFVDLIYSFATATGGLRPDLAVAETLLRIIGGIDLVVALLVVTTRWVPVAAWMAFWGMATAFARVIHAGPSAWPEVALRSVHFGVPLALLVVFASSALRARDPLEKIRSNDASTT